MNSQACIYRMVTPKHLCPWGVNAYDLLKRNGYEIEDHHLESKEANIKYKQEHSYDETPQIFIGGERIGGYDALRKHLGLKPDPKTCETYQPVLTVYAVTFLMMMGMSLWMIFKTSNP